MKKLKHLILALLLLSCLALSAAEQIPVIKTYGGIIDIYARLTDDEPPQSSDGGDGRLAPQP
jgi:hypothetical protein